MIKGICFDFGGTLAHRQGKGEGFSRTISKALGKTPDDIRNKVDEYLLTKKGDPAELLRKFCEKVGYKKVQELLETTKKGEELLTPFEDTKKTLDELTKNFKLGMITNSFCWNTSRLERINLQNYFDVQIYSHEVGLVKPNPAIFRIAEKNLGLKPEELAYVGDLPHRDVLGAKNAGWTSVFLDRKPGFFKELYSPDYIIHELTELIELSEQWLE